jgi:hypothetical protein
LDPEHWEDDGKDISEYLIRRVKEDHDQYKSARKRCPLVIWTMGKEGVSNAWTREIWQNVPVICIADHVDMKRIPEPRAGAWVFFHFTLACTKFMIDHRLHLVNKRAELEAIQQLHREIGDHWRIVNQYQYLKEG